MRRGLVRPAMNDDYITGGFEIDRDLRAIGKSGQVTPNIWIMGYPVEGVHFYTHAIPRTGLPSRLFSEAKQAVSSFFELQVSKQNSSMKRKKA